MVPRSIFVPGRKPHPLITPYHLIAPIITTTLKHFLFDTGFLIKNKQDHTPSDDILKTRVYYDNYPCGKKMFSEKPNKLMEPGIILDHLLPSPRLPGFRLRLPTPQCAD